MDPNTAYANFMKAGMAGWDDERFDAAEALAGWLNMGGFPPQAFDDLTPDPTNGGTTGERRAKGFASYCAREGITLTWSYS